MLIHSIIFALGLQIMFADSMTMGYMCGTDYYYQKVIVLNLDSFCDPNKVLYHEIGHQLFLQDQEVKDFLKPYPAPRYYYHTSYPTEDMRLNEKVADYFEMYISYSDFPDKFPLVNKLFNERTDYILNNLARQ